VARLHPAVFEASFLADGVFVAVDVLERRRGGWNLVEVKSTTKVKDPHSPDVAVQLHVLRSSGLDVKRSDLMHLNSGCTFPDLRNLFVRADVTAEAEALLPGVPAEVRRLRAAIAGDLPDVAPGLRRLVQPEERRAGTGPRPGLRGPRHRRGERCVHGAGGAAPASRFDPGRRAGEAPPAAHGRLPAGYARDGEGLRAARVRPPSMMCGRGATT